MGVNCMSLAVWLGEDRKCSAAVVGLDLVLGLSHVRLHFFILTEACSCGLELAYFAGKNISKNVCKNAVALAYYGSWRLLVMGTCYDICVNFFKKYTSTDHEIQFK